MRTSEVSLLPSLTPFSLAVCVSARARAIAKRVISFSALIGVVLSVVSQIVLPYIIHIFCSSQPVVDLTSRY
jgi:Na+-driven multidrug efflux pump